MDLSDTKYSIENNSAIIQVSHVKGPVKIVIDGYAEPGKLLSSELFEKAIQVQMPKILDRIHMYLSVHYCEEIHLYLDDFSPLPFGWDWNGPVSQALNMKFVQQNR